MGCAFVTPYGWHIARADTGLTKGKRAMPIRLEPILLTTLAVTAVASATALAHEYTRDISELNFSHVKGKKTKGLKNAPVWVEGDYFVDMAKAKGGKWSRLKPKGDRHWVVVEGEIANPFGEWGTLEPGSFFTNPSKNRMEITCLTGECLLYHYSRNPNFRGGKPGNGPLNQKGGTTVSLPALSDDAFAGKFYPFGEEAGVWMSTLQGDTFGSDHGTMLFFPAGFFPEMVTGTDAHIHTGSYTGVVLSGELRNPFWDEAGNLTKPDTVLLPGDHWFVPGDSIHTTVCDSPEGCLTFFRGSTPFDFVPVDFTP